MKKVPAVEQVRVSLKDGLTVLDLKPENTVTLAQLRHIIKNNGFVSRDVGATARGVPSPDQKTFMVSGSNEQLRLSEPARKTGENWEVRVRAPEKP